MQDLVERVNNSKKKISELIQNQSIYICCINQFKINKMVGKNIGVLELLDS